MSTPHVDPVGPPETPSAAPVKRLEVDLLPEQIDSATALRDEDYYDARPPHHG